MVGGFRVYVTCNALVIHRVILVCIYIYIYIYIFRVPYICASSQSGDAVNRLERLFLWLMNSVLSITCTALVF